MKMRSALFLAVTLLADATPASAANDDEPGGYAVRVPVTPAAGASLQRLEVPVQALVASREGGLADLRIFDAQGRALPIALSPLPAPLARHAVRLPVLPILGAPDALTVTGVSLRIDTGLTGVVQVQGVPHEAAEATLLGVLLDTRALIEPADRLRLDTDIPRGRPITFAIASSADLRAWAPVAEKTLYSASGGSTAAVVDLPSVALQGRYLRVTWSSGAPVSVRSGIVTSTAAADRSRWPRAIIRPAAGSDARVITFALPFASPVAALEVAITGADAVVPVRILGRNDREQPWTPIATGSVFRVTANNMVRRSPSFDLGGTGFRTFRIEADARSAGFAAPPDIAARFAPVRLLFLASGAPPFTLAAGQAGAAAPYLPAASLVPAYGPATEAALPVATTPTMPEPVIAAAADRGGSRQTILLWGVLLAATALLGAMVHRLMRQRAPAA